MLGFQRPLWLAGAALAAFSTPAFAEEMAPFTLSGEISIEVQDDYTFESDDPDAELNDLYTTIEPSIDLYLGSGFTIHSDLVFEPLKDAADDRAFEDEGLYAETLFLQYDGGGWGVFGGKFNPAFGIAWDAAPGIWGTDFAEDYEVTERIGFGGFVEFGGGAAGTHTLSASTFFADTSFLSGSVFTEREELDESDGGPSNTEDFSSFAVSLDGGEVEGLEWLGYHVAVRSQEGGTGDAGDDFGIAGALTAGFDLTEDVAFEGLVEVADFDEFDAGSDDVTYWTTGGALLYQGWNLSASFTARNTDVAGGGDVDDKLYQVSAGYEFANGFTIDAGYRFEESGGVESNAVGMLASYVIAF